MSLAHIRPWIAATAQCSRRTLRPTAGGKTLRCLSSAAGEVPLQTPDDWTNFQLKRADYQALIDHLSTYGSTQTRENTFQPHHTLHRPVAPANVTVSALLAAGAHFGHNQTLMNPNFMPYAYGVRAGVTVIDLDHTLPLLRRAANVVRGVAAKGGTIVFVGTRPDLRPVVRKAAERVGQRAYHVGEKWLPGTLTNKIVMFGPEVAKEEQVVPDLVILLNPIQNVPAIRECAIEHVPTIGIVDSNVDPRIVMYPIPANDENTRTAELIGGLLSIAGREGAALYRDEQARRAKKAERVQRGHERVYEAR
ncbi:ribosomal protein S2, flavodoxin-like domain-containing protein [Amylocystis lapponica]|nr:ribosomal protein S2, flavodoxin-like domain-containing protein [Amylocystis lapponica]